MDRAMIKKIMLAVFFLAGMILPQYSAEFKAMEVDPEFLNTVVFIVTAVLAWFTNLPEPVKKLFEKKQ